MILYDVECPKGHRFEIILTSDERAEMLKKNDQICVPCEHKKCSETAVKDPIARTGNNSIQWRRAAHGTSM